MQLEVVKDYYGKLLKSSNDLKTSACCDRGELPAHLQPLLANVHPEVAAKYYGCGIVVPAELGGLRVLDLGSGSGRDTYMLAQLVGASGEVVGVDMTDEQLATANAHLNWHQKRFGYARGNVRFLKGYIERLDELGLEPESSDVVVSNRVINLSVDKPAVLRGALRLLQPGGELLLKSAASAGQAGAMEKFDLTRRLAAEALGTALLVAAVVGSGIMAARLSGGNTALALLCNTLATGAMLFVIITIFAPLSGAHFNPAVSLVMWLIGELDRRDALAYILVQIVGGCLGALFAHVMFGLSPLQLGTTARTGWPQWLAEFVATFGLLMTILGCVRFKPEAVAFAVGLYITSAYWFTASTSFANPAVTIARSLSDTFAGIAPRDAAGFIVAEILGALAAAWLGGWLFASTSANSRPSP